MRRITVITTGGTIEKVYDEASGELVNRASQVRRMLDELQLEDTEISVLEPCRWSSPGRSGRSR